MANSLVDVERQFLANKLGLTLNQAAVFSLDELRLKYWLQGDPVVEPPPPAAGLTGEELVIRDSLGSISATMGDIEDLAAQVEAFLLEAQTESAEVQAALAETNDFQAFVTGDSDSLATHSESQSLSLSDTGESNSVPTETSLIEAQVSSTESQAAQSETFLSDISITDSETRAALVETVASDLNVTQTESNATPVETELLEAQIAQSESQAAQVETFLSEISITVDETQSALVETTLSDLTITQTESNPTPTETTLTEITTDSSESNPIPTEAQSVEISGINDPISVQTEGDSTSIKSGAATASAVNMGGSGVLWTPTANALGLEDGTLASLTSPGGLTPARAVSDLHLSYNSLGTMANETVDLSSVKLVFNVSLTLAALTTGFIEVWFSVDNGTTYDLIFTASATTAMNTYTGSGLNLNPVNLGIFKVRVRASVIGGTATASTASIDSAVVIFTTT